MAVAAFKQVVVVGYIVYGGRRWSGGPSYMLLQPGGNLFPTREAAADRARQIAQTDDWWVEPLWKRDS